MREGHERHAHLCVLLKLGGGSAATHRRERRAAQCVSPAFDDRPCGNGCRGAPAGNEDSLSVSAGCRMTGRVSCAAGRIQTLLQLTASDHQLVYECVQAQSFSMQRSRLKEHTENESRSPPGVRAGSGWQRRQRGNWRGGWADRYCCWRRRRQGRRERRSRLLSVLRISQVACFWRLRGACSL